MNTMKHLTLLRHGRSAADDEKRFEGRYDSPLTDIGRAQAESLCAELWMERDPGALSGLTRKEGMRRFPMPEFIGPYDRICDGTGESAAQTYSRALAAVEQLTHKDAERILVVAHGAIIQFAICAAFGIPVPFSKGGVSFKLGDTSYYDLTYNPSSSQWALLFVTHPSVNRR